MLPSNQQDMIHSVVFPKPDKAMVQPKTNEMCLNYLPDQPKVAKLIYKVLEGYLNNCCTVQQCLIHIQTSLSQSEISQLVSLGTMSVLNKSKSSRLRTGFLFAQLIKMNILSISNYCVGLEVIFKQADQLVIDVPKLWSCLAEIISPVICGNAITLKDLHNVIKLLGSGKNYVEELLTCIFKLIIQDKRIPFLQSIWKNSNLTFSDFMDECQVDHFVKKNNFEFLLKVDVTTSSLQSFTLCSVDDSNNVATIKPPEIKTLSKTIGIVEELSKPIKTIVPNPAVSHVELGHAALVDDNLVQLKNEADSLNVIHIDTETKINLLYEDDQWSPHDKDGKKVYDRDFLLALRKSPMSNIKPDNLPAGIVPIEDSGCIGDISGYASSTKRRDPPKRKSQQSSKGGSGGSKKADKQSGICVSSSIKEDEELYKSVTDVLNKLTSQKFEALLDQVRSLSIDTPERLQGVIDLVFKKVVDKPNFSLAYALLCRELALMQVPATFGKNEGKEFVNFRKLLIARCRLEFEKNSIDDMERRRKIKEIEDCPDVEKKKDMQLDLDQYDRCLRMKSFGNIKFIGELFKQQMLTVNIILRCLNNLLDTKDEVSLECLCVLLTTVGKELQAKKVDLDSIFPTIQDLADNKHGIISSRVRFMIQDIIDLRSSQWIPQRQDLDSKTMDEMQKKAENEQALPKCDSQQSSRGCSSKADQEIKISVFSSVKEDGKLHETDNASKPPRFIAGAVMTEDDKKTEELYKKVQGGLNKLTPQKCETLLDQVRSLSIDTAERLQGLVDLVFEKAVDEPNFSVAYALLSRELALMQVPATEGKKKEGREFVNFRELLLTRCQLEFEKNSIDETERSRRMKEIEDCPDVEKKKDMQIDLDKYDRRLRMKSVGNIRFIGELFKQQMLTVNVMLRCLNNLLDTKDEESLECLCELLTTVGKELETKKVDLGGIFSTMKDLADKKQGRISSRVRFMIQDVIDLRSSRWIPRRQDLNPKTMDQIQKEAETEQMTIQYVTQPVARGPTQAFFPRALATSTSTSTQSDTNNGESSRANSNGQQRMYQTPPTQFVPMAIQQPMYHLNTSTPVPYFNSGARPQASYVAQGYPMIPSQTIAYQYPQQPPQPQAAFYYSTGQVLQQRQPPPVATAPPNPTQPPAPTMSLGQPIQQHGSHTKNKRRSRPIPIIDPSTGKDKLSEMYEQEQQDDSHPASGESSARQTPQPPLPNPNKEIQAAFAKQVAQAIDKDEAAGVEELEQQHTPVMDHVMGHMFQPPPQMVHQGYDNLVQSSKLHPKKGF